MLREHTGRVTWSAPVRFLENTTIADLSIPVKFFYQACAESCLPPKTEQVTAEYVGELSKAPAVEAAEFAEGEAIATQEKHEGLKQNSSGKGAEAKTTVQRWRTSTMSTQKLIMYRCMLKPKRHW